MLKLAITSKLTISIGTKEVALSWVPFSTKFYIFTVVVSTNISEICFILNFTKSGKLNFTGTCVRLRGQRISKEMENVIKVSVVKLKGTKQSLAKIGAGGTLTEIFKGKIKWIAIRYRVDFQAI